MDRNLRIVLPTRPQPDTIVAIFLLKTFGQDRFPGIKSARIEVQPLLSKKSFDAHLAEGILPIDVGGGSLDHHGTEACASELVAIMLGIEKDPSIGKLLAYAKRDDTEGKGTVSADPLDRAFGLSGLISSLNKQYPKDAQKIVETVLPLLEAHYVSSREHHVELPAEVKEKKARGEYSETTVKQGKKTLRVSFVVSDKPSMPTYLRSWNGARADVVVQKAEKGTRVCVITRQDRNVNLATAAALIRMREAELRGIEINEDQEYLASHGKLVELPFWYFDPMTNSILNVGEAGSSDDTVIPWEEKKRIVLKGLELAPERA